MLYSYGKRLFDVCVTLPVLVVLSPLMCLLAMLVWRDVGRPVLFRQQRSGLLGVAFEICKFRTMREAEDDRGCALPDVKRVTPVGRWLRSTSLDELPQLISVLNGQMSLVGPRPLMAKYLTLYGPTQRRRLEVKPGITGWAQIGGRNTLGWEERFVLDVWYVDNMSLLIDLRILAITIWKILRRQGVSAEGQVTMEEFQGSHPGE